MSEHRVESIRQIIQTGAYEWDEDTQSGPEGTPECDIIYELAHAHQVEEDWREWPTCDAVADAGGDIATYLWDFDERGLGMFDHGTGETSIIPWDAIDQALRPKQIIHEVRGSNFHGSYCIRLRGPAEGFHQLSEAQERKVRKTLCGRSGCKCGGSLQYGDGPEEGTARIVVDSHGRYCTIRAGYTLAEVKAEDPDRIIA